jgi:uncharacterized membrane protein
MTIPSPDLLALGMLSATSLCPGCLSARDARTMLFDQELVPTLLIALAPFLVTLAIILLVVRAVSMRGPAGVATATRLDRGNAGPLIGAGLLVGVGLGGFVDGILLHQILQWHNMLSSWVPPLTLVEMKFNMIWDGLFHAVTWICTVVGIALLFRAARYREAWSAKRLLGSMLGGWGLFNLVEGLLDHQLFGIHHVHPGEHQVAWDVGFLISGIALVAAGFALERWCNDHGKAHTQSVAPFSPTTRGDDSAKL